MHQKAVNAVVAVVVAADKDVVVDYESRYHFAITSVAMRKVAPAAGEADVETVILDILLSAPVVDFEHFSCHSPPPLDHHARHQPLPSYHSPLSSHYNATAAAAAAAAAVAAVAADGEDGLECHNLA